MQCIVKNSLYPWVNGKTATIEAEHIYDNGLLEIVVDGERYVVATSEVSVIPDLRNSVAANEVPY